MCNCTQLAFYYVFSIWYAWRSAPQDICGGQKQSERSQFSVGWSVERGVAHAFWDSHGSGGLIRLNSGHQIWRQEAL